MCLVSDERFVMALCNTLLIVSCDRSLFILYHKHLNYDKFVIESWTRDCFATPT